MKRIAIKNLPVTFNLGQVVSFWFLWDKFPQEWVRTILALGYSLMWIGILVCAFRDKYVDIFKDK